MKNLPEQIYLNLGDGLIEEDTDFRKLSDVTWSEKKQFDNDMRYVRGDIVMAISRLNYLEDINLGLSYYEKVLLKWKNEKTKLVYLVKDRDNGKVVYVASTEQKALEYVDVYGTGYYTEPIEMNKEIQKPNFYLVSFHIDHEDCTVKTNATVCKKPSALKTYYNDTVEMHKLPTKDIYLFYLVAEDYKQAIFIGEERLKFIKDNPELFPRLGKNDVTILSTNGHTYMSDPIYNYNTKQIINEPKTDIEND